jgi:hypothetical protein
VLAVAEVDRPAVAADVQARVDQRFGLVGG